MYSGILITFREGVEAFLIVGILLGYLAKIGQRKFSRFVWLGTAAAIGVTLLLAIAFHSFAIQFGERESEVFEILVSVLAIGILTWMVLWMQRQSRVIKADLESRVSLAISANKAYGIAILAFMSVLREGLETALFLSALVGTAGGGRLLWGAIVGLFGATLIVYLVFKTTVQLNLRRFFIVSGSLLILIAAGLVAHSIMGLQELGLVSPVIKELWNTNGVLNEDSLVGRLLHALMGYDGNPSLMQAIGYLAYVGTFSYLFLRAIKASDG